MRFFSLASYTGSGITVQERDILKARLYEWGGEFTVSGGIFSQCFDNLHPTGTPRSMIKMRVLNALSEAERSSLARCFSAL